MMNKLDLHNVKHEDVVRMLDTFLYKQISLKSDYAIIITGKSSEMKKIVYDVAVEYDFNATEEYMNGGAIFINLK